MYIFMYLIGILGRAIYTVEHFELTHTHTHTCQNSFQVMVINTERETGKDLLGLYQVLTMAQEFKIHISCDFL